VILSALRRGLLALLLLALPQVALAQFTLVRTSSPVFYNDVGNNPSLQCMYASYEVTNTGGSTIADVWVDITNFTGGVVTLAPTEDGLVQLGAMAPGQKKTAYFYLRASSTSASAQHHTVHVYASRPPTAAALTQNFAINSVESTINANANKVTTVVSGPNPPQVGGIVTITVTGQTGTIGAPPVLAFSPAADVTWPAMVFEMVSTQITLSGSANAGVITDSLIFTPGSSSSTDYVAVYTLRAAGSTAAPTFVTPIGYFASGANVKHTDTGNYGGFDPIPPPQSLLTLTKSATPTFFIDGGISTYTVRVTNAGFAGTTLDDLKDILPGTSSYVPGTSTYDGVPIADPAQVGQTLFWYGPLVMPPNASRDLVYQVSFPKVAGTFVNQALAHVGAAIIDSTLALTDSLPAHAPVTVYVRNSDVSITKGDAPDPIAPGGTLTYTLFVRAAGPDTAFSVSALDTLPAGVIFVSAVTTHGTVGEAAGVVTAALGDLLPDSTATITITVTVGGPATLVNTARVSSPTVDYTPGNNAATATTTVAIPPTPDLQFVKRAAAAAYTVGEIATYDLTVTNLGTASTGAAITVLDTLPAGVAFVSGSGSGWSVSESGGVVTATFAGALAVPDSAQVSILVRVGAAAVPSVTNFARTSTFGDTDASNDTSSVAITVSGAPDLHMAKSHAGNFSVGLPGQYTLTVRNDGSLPTSGTITVLDTLAAGLSFVSGNGLGWSVNESLGIVTATFAGGLSAGDSLSFTIDVSVAASAGPSVLNTAVVQTAGDLDPANDRALDLTQVVGFPDVQMVKRASPSLFTVGGTATWTLTATNVGSGATTGPITITDTLAPGLTYLNATGAGFLFSFTDPTLTATYAGALAPGDSATVTLTAHVGAAATPVASNTAVANTPGDTSAGNDSSTTATNVAGAPDLRIVKSHTGNFTVGQPGQYTITVYNDGSLPSDPSGTGFYAVVDTLPAGLTFVSGSGGGFSVTESGGIVSAPHLSALQPGDSTSFVIDVAVGPAAAPLAVNAATVTTAGDINAANDRALDPTTVVALAPDLQVIKRALAEPFTVGGTGTYTITVTNLGTGPTIGPITITDALPAALTYLAGSGAGFGVVEALGVVTATGAGPIAAGDSAVITIDAHVGAFAAPSVGNTATVSTAGDPNSSNDTSTISTAVTSAPDVRLEKTHATDFTVGLNGQYRIAAFNEGSLPTPSTIVVRDTLPAGLSFVAGNGAGWSFVESTGIVEATKAGPIAPGDSAAFLLDVAVTLPAFPGVTNAATAATPGDVDAANDRAVDPTVVLPGAPATPDLQMVKRAVGAPFTVGGTATYTLTVTNIGTGPTTGPITITDTLAPVLSFLGGSGTGWTVNEALGVVTATNSGPIAVGDSAVATIDAHVGPGAVPSVDNQAIAATLGDASAGNDSSSTTSAVNGAPDLRLAKTHTGNFTEGQTGQYILTVFNDGSLPTTGTITVLDTLPAGLTFVSGAGAGWTISELAGIVTATSAGPIAAAANDAFTIDVSVSAAAVPGVTNTAVASTPGDVDPGNDRALDPTVVDAAVAAPDLGLAKSHVGSFTVGAIGTYTLMVTNLGTAEATGTITVTDSLPAGLTFASASGPGWSFAPVGTAVTATHPGPLAVGDTLTFTLDVAAGPAALPSATNVAIAQTAGDLNSANDRATDVTGILGSPDLALVKRHLGTLTVGTNGQYEISVLNLGTAATTGTITVLDTLPSGLDFVSAAGTGWSPSFAGGVLTATTAGPIAPGDSATILLTVSVDEDAYPNVLNAAEVQALGDLNPANNRGSDLAATSLAPSAILALEKRAAPSVVEPADVVSYALVIRNLSVTPVPAVVVRDTLPVGFRYATGTASVNGSPIADPAGAPGAGLAFSVGTVPASGTLTLRYRALVGTAAVLGDGVNRAFAENAGLGIQSNLAAAKVTIKGGVFGNEGVIAGKVWSDCGCDSNRVQGQVELGVPGVRVYLEDGRSAVTDVEGKYHFEAVSARLHTVKLDRTTLPLGARPVTLDTRNALDPDSHFADMKNGELFRADFALAGCEPSTIGELKARRELGEVRAAILTGQPTLAANVDPGATRVLDGTPWMSEPAAKSDQGAYFHIQPGSSLDAANSRVPDAPGTPGLLLGHAPETPSGLSISVPRRPAPADGRTLVPVTVRVPGDEPVPVTLDSNLGLWQVADQDPGHDGIQTHVTHQATFVLVTPPQPGAAIVRVTQVTEWKGKVTAAGPGALTSVRAAEAELLFVPAARPWLVLGTIEGRYDGRSVHDADLAPGQLRDRFEDAFGTVESSNDNGTSQLGGRSAVFARGSLGNDALVTFRFDSERAHERRRFDDIRPDEGDPVFGDASVQGFEAQSTERLYGRIERGRSYALYGDFMTEGLDPIRVLGAYTRGINGGRAHLEDGRAALDAFATHDRDRQVVDEIPGRGISGPYPLSRRDGVLNSERVEIVTRDRNNPSVILERKLLMRFADYTIEPFTGRLLFRAPVASLDERLNPVSIRVVYEVEGGGERFWTIGGSAHVRPAARIELMGSYVKEDDPLEEHAQYGAGTTIQLLSRTFLTGEWAHTDSAGTLASNAYRGEIRHASDKLDLRGFGLRTDPGFDNPSSGFAPGREEWGGAGRYALDARTGISAEGVRSRNVVTNGRRKGASLLIDRRLGDKTTLGLGYRWARESVSPAGGGPAVPTPNETDAARARLALQFSKRTSAYLEYEKNFGHGSSKRLELGTDIRVTDHVRAYGRHEFLNGLAGPYALNELQAFNTTVIGMAADGREDLTAFSEYRVRDAFSGRNAEAAIGLRDRLRVSPNVRVLLSMERVAPSSGSGVTALASGLEWTGDPLTKGSLRLEFRTASLEDQWLASAGLARKLGRDWTGLARSTWSWSPGHLRTVARDELAFALRETDVNHWNALGRFEHRLDEQQLSPGITSRHEVYLASTRLNVKALRPLTMIGRVAGKWTFDESEGRTLDGRGSLASLRALYDLSPRLDLALSARSRFDGSWSRRTDGLGAELGFVVLKNLRLAGGYNAFGFHDLDFASLERTDKGPFVAFGFKFDEGLFGGGKAPAPPPPASPQTDVQRGAILTTPQDTLRSAFDRISDQAIATDLRTIDSWRARVDALPDSLGIYGRAKARAWLELAREAYTDKDRTGDADRALANAVALQRAMSGPGGVDSAAFAQAAAATLPGAGSTAEAGLLAMVTQVRTSPGLHCAEEEVARAEVELAWATHQTKMVGCRAQPHLEEARRLSEAAAQKAADCVKAAIPEAPVDTTQAPPVAPNAEIEEALSEIPAGIHFALNKNDLSPTSRSVITRIAAVLVKYPNVRVELEGHTDSRGSVAYNLALSKRRADAVKSGLVQAGVDPSRISATFAGKENLLNAEKDVRDLALNRRVDFKYFDQNGVSIAARKQTGDIQIEQPAAKRPARRTGAVTGTKAPAKAPAKKTTPTKP
jgi:uncharacterized repeat protein (TIGR01451 family)